LNSQKFKTYPHYSSMNCNSQEKFNTNCNIFRASNEVVLEALAKEVRSLGITVFAVGIKDAEESQLQVNIHKLILFCCMFVRGQSELYDVAEQQPHESVRTRDRPIYRPADIIDQYFTF